MIIKTIEYWRIFSGRVSSMPQLLPKSKASFKSSIPEVPKLCAAESLEGRRVTTEHYLV